MRIRAQSWALAGLALIALLLAASPVSAQKSSGSFDGGSVMIGYDDRSCGPTLEGAMRFNSAAGGGGGGGDCDLASGDVEFVSKATHAPNLEFAFNIELSDDETIAFVGGQWNRRIAAYDISNTPSTPTLIGVSDIIWELSDSGNMVRVGDYIYATSKNPDRNVVSVNVSDPSNPVFADRVQPSTANQMENVWGIAASEAGGHVYSVSWGSGSSSNTCFMHTIDILDPGNLSIVHTLNLTSASGTAWHFCNDIKVRDNIAYVTFSNGMGIMSIDVSNPAAPSYLSRVSHADAFRTDSIAFSQDGNYLFTSSSSWDLNASCCFFNVWNISDPSSMAHVASLQDQSLMYESYGIGVRGDYAFVTGSNSNAIAVIDVSDPANPQIVNSLVDATNLNDPTRLRLAGRYAYVTLHAGNSLTVIDLGCDAAGGDDGGPAIEFCDATEWRRWGN